MSTFTFVILHTFVHVFFLLFFFLSKILNAGTCTVTECVFLFVFLLLPPLCVYVFLNGAKHCSDSTLKLFSNAA